MVNMFLIKSDLSSAILYANIAAVDSVLFLEGSDTHFK
jgi:hypothetical protein